MRTLHVAHFGRSVAIVTSTRVSLALHLAGRAADDLERRFPETMATCAQRTLNGELPFTYGEEFGRAWARSELSRSTTSSGG